MRKRAERVDETRQRIIEATVQLHGTVGPAATTIMGIAEQAQVTRLTVYRHFPDEGTLFAACSAHWLSQRVLPDPDSWSQIADPLDRLRSGLTDLYRFYRAGESMLSWIYRDKASLPAANREFLERRDAHFRDVLIKPFVATGAQRRRLRAVLGHAVSFWTWRSLCIEHGLSNREAVEAMAALTLTTTSA
ncbi:MAG TPA: TetR family transcriptional regulator [Micromonosporaceae bacterium]|nr:TetR family transcriptional regulator [Micromonosporaceae bacterium]HCU51044.1 TetR family transcriptional regulator [Micromonosporaceae bacterium]